jgi:DNA-binding GntR family transcriptional regulator
VIDWRRRPEELTVPETPAYLRIATELRARIMSGEVPAGAKLPTETRLMSDYRVSRTVAKWAIGVLKGEGLVEGRRGSGVYVREVQRLVRRSGWRDIRSGSGKSGSTSPFARDADAAGAPPRWNHESRLGDADVETARRLGISVGAPVMETNYVFFAGDQVVQMSYSREPLAITLGTAIEWPEDGAAVGVVARFDHIGVRITEVEESLTARPAHPLEVETLQLPPRGATVLAIARTYFAGERAVETADIVFPSDRYELVYRLPVA